jgi:hypothetical protein
MEGYVYCFSNKSLGLKVGSSNVSPQEILIELNIDSEEPFVLELSKNVFDYKKKEQMLINLLSPFKSGEYYQIEVDKIETLFDLFDEVSFVNSIIKEDDFKRIQSQMRKRKKLSDYFENGQIIRHVILEHEWSAEYNKEYDGIYYNNCILTLKQFVSSHCESLGKKSPSNIWKSCEYFKDNHWLSFHLKEAL